ncbi:hypothetical protein GQR36_03605 [Enterococcus termitis]
MKRVQVSLTADMKQAVALTLHGEKTFTIPPNQRLWTDSVAFDIPPAHELYFELELQNERNLLPVLQTFYLMKSFVAKNTQDLLSFTD